MSAKNNECRFCLRVLESNEKTHSIDHEIKESFKFITHIDLKSAVKYSKLVCIVCLRSLQLAHAVIIQFSENQQKLETKFNSNGSTPSTSSGDPLIIPSEVIQIPGRPIVKEEEELDVIKYEPHINYTGVNHDEEMDYNQETEDHQSSVNWNFVGSRTGSKLNKQERVSI
jgi:hypothetical protein